VQAFGPPLAGEPLQGEEEAQAFGSPPAMKGQWNHKPFARFRRRLHAFGSSLVEPLECAKQFCRRAPCAPQVKAIASHKVKRFQKRSRAVKNL